MEVLILAVILSFLFSYSAYSFKTLTVGGALSAFVLAALLISHGREKWILPLLFFFISSNLIGKLVSKKSTVKPGERRNVCQVLANGGVGGAIVLCDVFFHNAFDWYFLFLISLAAANADTWATEVGVLSKTPPRQLFSMKKVPKGQSGAVSLTGTVGAITGAVVIATFSLIYGYTITSFFTIVFMGTFGSLIDSLLGAFVQEQYLCSRCGGQFDVTVHCGQKGEYYRGFPFIGNNSVNFLSILLAVITAFFLT